MIIPDQREKGHTAVNVVNSRWSTAKGVASRCGPRSVNMVNVVNMVNTVNTVNGQGCGLSVWAEVGFPYQRLTRCTP